MNRREVIKLADKLVDNYSVPQVKFDSAYSDNEFKMRMDIARQEEEMARAAGAVLVGIVTGKGPPRADINKIGTAQND